VSLRRFGSRLLGLFTRSHVCANGPMQGEELILSEHSPNSAWLEVGGTVGRYVLDKKTGRLKWEDRKS
jgi:hypothetical protein